MTKEGDCGEWLLRGVLADTALAPKRDHRSQDRVRSCAEDEPSPENEEALPYPCAHLRTQSCMVQIGARGGRVHHAEEGSGMNTSNVGSVARDLAEEWSR